MLLVCTRIQTKFNECVCRRSCYEISQNKLHTKYGIDVFIPDMRCYGNWNVLSDY